MKKKFQKILAGTLAVIMVLTSFAFDFGKATEAEAADTNSGFKPGSVLADVDFAKTDVEDLDDIFVASEGTSDADRVTASNVSTYWKKGEEKQVDNAAYGGTAEMKVLSSKTAAMLIDNDENDFTSSVAYEQADVSASPEKATITFKDDAYYEVNKIEIVWRGNDGRPEDFYIELNTGSNWVTQEVLQFTGYEKSTDGNKLLSIEIEPTVCKGFRLVATKLRPDGSGKYYLQLREMRAWGTACTNVARAGKAEMNVLSSSYSAGMLNDGELVFTTSVAYDQADISVNPEKATIMFKDEAYYEINTIEIVWRGNDGRPEDFYIELHDGSDWVTQEVLQFTGYEKSTDGNKLLSIEIEPTVCKGFRLVATKLRTAGSKYHLQLSEMRAWGEKVDYLTTKTLNADGKQTLLTLKDVKAENFKVEIGMVYFNNANTLYSLFFGQSAPGVISGAKEIRPNLRNGQTYGGIRADGVDTSSPAYVEADAEDYLTNNMGGNGLFNAGSTTAVYTKASINDFPTACNDGNLQTLNVEVIDSVAKIWWTGFEKTAWTVRLTDYEGGYISLLSQGADEGGFVSFKLQEYFRGNSVNFAETDVEELDDMFVASEGTSDADRVTADNVSTYWKKGEETEDINAAITGTAEMEVLSGSATELNNNDETNFISSIGHDQADISDAPEIATITFENDAYYNINTIEIVWRGNDGRPEDFYIELNTGSEWVTQEVLKFTEYPISAEKIKLLTIDIEPTVCKGFRLVATKLRTDSSGTYYLQLREMRAWGTACTNAALSGTAEMDVLSSNYSADMLNDGETAFVSSPAHSQADISDNPEIATITFEDGAYYEINTIEIVWRGNDGRPEDFYIELNTGSDWVTQEVLQFTAYPTSAAKIKLLSIEIEPTVCKGFRLVATKLRTDSSGKYYLQLSEMRAWGEKVDYLTTKTVNADGKTTLLTLKDIKAENFRAEIEMVYFNSANTKYGIYFGQTAPGITSGAKEIRPNLRNEGTYGGVRADGVDTSSPVYVEADAADYLTNKMTGTGLFNAGSATAVYTKASINNFPTACNNGNIQTLNVEVIDGVAKIWWTGFEKTAWAVRLTDYEGGYISLFSQGADVGGFVSFKFQEIKDSAIQTNAHMEVEVLGDYTIVSVTNDIAQGILKNSTFQGNVKYDADKYEYCTTIITDSKVDVHQNVDETASDGSVAVNFQSYNKDAVAKLYFKNKTNAIDYNNFAIADGEAIRANETATKASVTTTLNIAYDYTGTECSPDKCVDARDLVRAAKDNKAPDDVRNALVGVGSEWISFIVKEDRTEVYVDATKGTVTGEGTVDSPLNSLQLAAYRVANNGTIHVVGDYAFNEDEKTIGVGGKTITITGENGTLILTGVSDIDVVGNLIIDNIKVTGITVDPTTTDGMNATLNFYANGHHLKVTQNAKFTGYIKNIYAGNSGEMPLTKTNMELYGGSYGLIYGGSCGDSTILGGTNLTIGGTVNHDNGFDEMDSSHKYNEFIAVYGGSQDGYVKGDTNVTIQDQAHISMVNGGGHGPSSTVAGTCNVYVKGGKTVGYYGGSLGGTVKKTNLVMTGGETEQIFGGSWIGNHDTWSAGITGSTNVTFIGGTVTRRIFGGCYSENSSDGNIVIGTTTVNIGGEANYTHSYDSSSSGLCAGSCYSTNSDDEISVLNFTADKYAAYSKYIDNFYKCGNSDTINENWTQE